MTASPRSSGVDPAFRDLAILLSVMQGMPEADPKAAIARLAPLTAPGNPWRPTAVELTAAARLKLGDKKGALALYKSLADDLAAPRSLRARAAEMAAALLPIVRKHSSAMFRPVVAALLLVGLVLAGCSWFASKKQPLPGERISVLSLDRRLEPDPDARQHPDHPAAAGGQSGLARARRLSEPRDAASGAARIS